MDKIDLKHNDDRYENIFNVYELYNENDNNYVFYNITNKITLPSDLDESVFEYYRIEAELPLTTISYRIYRSQFLWWLILLCNDIKNPIKNIAGGSVLKVVKPEFLDKIFDSIKQKI